MINVSSNLQAGMVNRAQIQMPDSGTVKQPGRKERVQFLEQAGCCHAAFRELVSAQKQISARHAIWGIKLLCDAFEFEKAVAFFNSLQPGVKQHPDVFLGCVYALASAFRFDDARNMLEVFVQKGLEETISPRKLVMVAPIANERTLAALISRAILNIERFDDEILIHYLYELGKRRGLGIAADTLLGVYELKQSAGTGSQEEYLFRSNLAFDAGDYRLQGEMVSKAIESYGFAGITLKDTSQPVSVTNLEAVSGRSAITDGPLVSVIVAAYNAAQTIEMAARSLFGQTYRNIEAIFVDDGSSDGTPGILQRLCEKEPRARVVRLDKNYGLFTALNSGLSHSSGELVTRQDADDWVHPERLGLLVSTLCERPDVIAAQTRTVRCSAHLGLESQQTGYARTDFPSLIYRRQKVRMELGFYDPVRVSGDAEFQKRLIHVFGEHSLLKLETIASIFNWSSETLTGGEEFAVRGPFRKPARAAYRKAFLRWHEQERFGGDFFIPFALKSRRFEAPGSVLGQDAGHF